MRITPLLAVLTACALVTGCNKKQAAKIDSLSAKLETCEKDITQLIARNADLEAELAKLKAEKNSPVPSEELDKIVNAQISAVMSNKLESLAVKVFEDRVGTEEDIEFIFRQAVQDELAMVEQKKKQAEEEAAEERRKEWSERRERWNQQRIDRMAQEIGLREEQKEPFAKIRSESNTRMHEKMREIWNEKGMDPEAMREARIALTKETEDQMREILSEEQFTSYTNSQAGQTRWIRRMESFFTDGTGNRGGGRSGGQAESGENSGARLR